MSFSFLLGGFGLFLTYAYHYHMYIYILTSVNFFTYILTEEFRI